MLTMSVQGVTGMWELLAPAQSVTRMEILGERGFKENKDSLRAFRLGIDAPQWLFHVRGANAESKDGECVHSHPTIAQSR